ncbi:MAG: acyl-CoA--6-aminopenicillanic acid acyltransferase [Bacteroidetes bacterium]|nr:MAG: acyl-CoA--6-aminopenicillanic acid acyltransferase [Bacteroidota bacterium]PTM13370.1 MAG: acyl-CoA--6-aminopenicillanic acid acyltransferase [Bacteroidota bacterium]
MQLHFNAISEAGLPGPKWKKIFDLYWPAYQAWLTSKGTAYVPDLQTSQAALKKYMPKMWPTYKRLCKLTNADPVAARFLTGFQPPAYISACSQAVTVAKTVQLVRNYDYHPDLMEGTLLLSAWNGKKVIATSDCLIGAIDGMNEDGLAISLTFGGRKAVGEGFGIPFILRYVLEFCSNVEEAVATLSAIPSHISYNVTVVDPSGAFKTVRLSPDRAPVITDAAFATNHQGTVDWPENALFNKTVERADFLEDLLIAKQVDAQQVAAAFLRPPLYNTLFTQGFGTLYTAVYNPLARTVQVRWPQTDILVSFDHFTETYKLITYDQPALLPQTDAVAPVLTEAQAPTSSPADWQEVVADVLVDTTVVSVPPEHKTKLKTLRKNIIRRGEISWEILVDYWAKAGEAYWKKW